MERIKLWARNGAAVRQAIELGEMAHIETASEELTGDDLARPYSGALRWPILDAQSWLCAALCPGVRGLGLQCRSCRACARLVVAWDLGRQTL